MTEESLDRTLKGLRRSSAVFPFAAGLVILVVLVSSIYTNIRVVQITNRLSDQQSTIRAQQHGLDGAVHRIALAGAFGDYHACLKVNHVRGQFLAFIDASVTRQQASTKATLASPSATAQQKQTAYRNLVGATFQQVSLHKALPLDHCVRPKEKP